MQDTGRPTMTGVVDDLARMARLSRLSIPLRALEGLAPRLESLYADLDRLLALPLAGVEPAFAPRVRGGGEADPPAP